MKKYLLNTVCIAAAMSCVMSNAAWVSAEENVVTTQLINENFDSGTYDSGIFQLDGRLAEKSQVELKEGSDTDRYLYLERYFESDTNAGTMTTNIPSSAATSYVLQFDFMMPYTAAGETRIMQVWDNAGKRSIYIRANGTKILNSDGTALVSNLEAGEWYNIEVLCDLEGKTSNIWVDGQSTGKEHNLFQTSSGTSLTKIETQISSDAQGNKAGIDNVHIQAFRDKSLAKAIVEAQNLLAKDAQAQATIGLELKNAIAIAEAADSTSEAMQNEAQKLTSLIEAYQSAADEKILWEDDFSTAKSYDANKSATLLNGTMVMQPNNQETRLLKSVSEADTASGVLSVSVDVTNNIKDDSNETSVFQMCEMDGTNPIRIANVYMKNGQIGIECKKSDTEKDGAILADYELGKSYNIKLVVDMDNKILMPYINGERVSLDKELRIYDGCKNIIRPFDSRNGYSADENANPNYTLDNLKISKDLMSAALDFTDRTTAENITLPTTTKTGFPVSWRISDPDIVSAEGVVTVGKSARIAILTAAITNGKYTEDRVYIIRVPAAIEAENAVFTQNGSEIKAMPASGDVTFSTTLKNNAKATEKVNVFVVLKKQTDDGSVIEQVKMDSLTVPAEGTDAKLTVTIPDDSKYQIQCFVWDEDMHSYYMGALN